MGSFLREFYLYVGEANQNSVHRFVCEEQIDVNYNNLFLYHLIKQFEFDKE